MSQLINITTDSFQAVRFTQHARLVPEESLDIERRKAIARHYAFASRNNGGDTHTRQVSQINSAFSGTTIPTMASGNTAGSMASIPSSIPASQTRIAASTNITASPVVSEPVHVSASENNDFASTVPSIAESAYHAQRGSFEMRVAKGSLSYVPELAMTIVTQRPEVHVEYIGGFNYFPASAAPENRQLNLFI